MRQARLPRLPGARAALALIAVLALAACGSEADSEGQDGFGFFIGETGAGGGLPSVTPPAEEPGTTGGGSTTGDVGFPGTDTGGTATDGGGPEEPVTEPGGPSGGPVDACFATSSGQVSESSSSNTMPLDYSGQPVVVNAQHLAGGSCLTRVGLLLSRSGQCPLNLTFIGDGQLWNLNAASLRSDPECGSGWGSGKTYSWSGGTATLLASPPKVALGPSGQSCTALLEPMNVAGELELEAGGTTIVLGLSGLTVAGALLSAAAQGGECGGSPEACQNLECGVDPLFGTSCGVCNPGFFCLGGSCEEGTPAQEACGRFNQDRAAMSEHSWSGSISSCSEASMSNEWQEDALLNVNLYRWFADLPPLTLNPSLHAGQQKCALIMDANNSLSHNPSSLWSCYSSLGADHAGSSNIATLPAVVAGDLYMIDPGNETTMGHRRWILSNWLEQTAFGSTSDYSCMATRSAGGGGGANKPWVSWPPAGFYPMDWADMGWTHMDKTGWTIQSDSINLNSAQVTVTENGATRAMTVSTLKSGYGSKYAIKMLQSGWKMKANTTYQVLVTGISPQIQYEVHTVDCSSIP